MSSIKDQLDGGFVEEDGRLAFVRAQPPRTSEVEALAGRIAWGAERCRGLA